MLILAFLNCIVTFAISSLAYTKINGQYDIEITFFVALSLVIIISTFQRLRAVPTVEAAFLSAVVLLMAPL